MLRGSMAFLTHRRIKSDLMKSKINLGNISSTDEKINLDGKKLEKMKIVFNDDLYEEVKEVNEENELESSEKENDEKKEKDKNEGGEKNENKEEIINLENLNIVNNGDKEEEKDKKNFFDKIEEVEEKEINEEKEDKKNKDKVNKKENIEPRSRRKSIVDKDVTRNVEIDEKILTSVNQKMDLLLK